MSSCKHECNQEIKSRDVRDILSIRKPSKTVEDVDFVATALQKYRRKNDEER
jgi:hypothetical protein